MNIGYIVGIEDQTKTNLYFINDGGWVKCIDNKKTHQKAKNPPTYPTRPNILRNFK